MPLHQRSDLFFSYSCFFYSISFSHFRGRCLFFSDFFFFSLLFNDRPPSHQDGGRQTLLPVCCILLSFSTAIIPSACLSSFFLYESRRDPVFQCGPVRREYGETRRVPIFSSRLGRSRGFMYFVATLSPPLLTGGVSEAIREMGDFFSLATWSPALTCDCSF